MFSEVAGKLAHIFQYAMNTTIGQDAAGPLVEFISEGIAVLETDLLMISANALEAAEDISLFKQKYPFAFQGTGQAQTQSQKAAPEQAATTVAESEALAIPALPDDGDVPAEILEFFVPEAEEHLQVVTDCLLSLETNPNPDEIHRLLRAMHTVKGSAAQVGLQRIARVAHRAEDLMGRVRDGVLDPSAEIIDVCLEAVDALKKFLYRQWADEAAMQSAVGALFSHIARLAPVETEQAVKVAEAPGQAE